MKSVGTGLSRTTVWRTVHDTAAAAIAITGTDRPDPHDTSVYRRLYPIYHSLYPAMKPHFEAITRGMSSE
jgi:hypothetical protein